MSAPVVAAVIALLATGLLLWERNWVAALWAGNCSFTYFVIAATRAAA